MFDFEVTIFTIARETDIALEAFTKRAKEGKSLQSAIEFSSYVNWSGISRLLENIETPKTLPVNGRLIRWKADELARIARRQAKEANVVTSIELSELELINRRLDIIAGRLAMIPTTPMLTTQPVLSIAAR